MATWVKICGVTRAEDARAAFDTGADAIGINFYAGSKRYCEPSRARDVVAALRPGEIAYGVFVNTPREEIARLVREVGLGGVQLHGSEPASEAEDWDVPVIRAIAATSRGAVREALGANATYRVLVDNAAGGGSGKIVDASLLEDVDLGRAILAGGLTPANVAATVARCRPFGVDTAGGVESAPGIKDPRLVEAFVKGAREGR